MAKDNSPLVIFLLLIAAGGAILTFSGLNSNALVTGKTNLTVVSQIAISLPTSLVEFGQMFPDAWNDTTDSVPLPFTIQNDGNRKVNVTISATSLFSTAPSPTDFYKFKIAPSGEGTCYIGPCTNTSQYYYMPTVDSNSICYLNYTDSCDTALIHINATVPSAESDGVKTSTVTFLAIQA
jgi:hypothetical protein